MTAQGIDLRTAAAESQQWLMGNSHEHTLGDGRTVRIYDSQTGGDTIVLVPVIEQMNFVFVPLIKLLSEHHRVILYSPQISRSQWVGVASRAAEIGLVLDSLDID